MAQLGEYLQEQNEAWQMACQRALNQNAWFTADSIQLAVHNICQAFLQRDKLSSWLQLYTLPQHARTVGLVMAGNIPLVGFHDFLCGFVCGHQVRMKLSEKDSVLWPHLLQVLHELDGRVAAQVSITDSLKNCDAYIATGSNNSARYFEQYFGKFPHIIRRNRTSVAVLDGTESEEDVQKLGLDIFSFFGLGCRNVTQLIVPEAYDFVPLLRSLESFKVYNQHNKYRNNYDYHLSLFLLNKVPHFDNGSLLLVENKVPFSAVSVLHYQYYQDKQALMAQLKDNADIQAIVGHGGIAFGTAQCPGLSDYADGVDTMAFLCSLP